MWWLPEMAVVLLILLNVAACGSQSESVSEPEQNNELTPVEENPDLDSMVVSGFDSTSQDATSPWFASVSLYRLNSELGTTGDATVNLVRYRDDFPVSNHVEYFGKVLDDCRVTDPDASPVTLDTDGSPPEFISGGVSVVINSPSGPWFTLNSNTVDGKVAYSIDNGLPGELLPDGATLSIPGDVFPSVAAHPLSDPAVPVRLLPEAGAPVTTDTMYSWVPGTGNSYMRISIVTDDAVSEFVDIVGCDVIDDGSFMMPPAVLEFVASSSVQLRVRYSRVHNRIDLVNNIAIRQQSIVAE